MLEQRPIICKKIDLKTVGLLPLYMQNAWSRSAGDVSEKGDMQKSSF